MVCRHWKEIDDDCGCCEYCRGALRRCSCCGDRGMCNYPQFYNQPDEDLERIRFEYGVMRSRALIEPYRKKEVV